jgi:hypothetical protein
MTLDHAAFQAWLDRYVQAWKSYNRDEIADLWSEDVQYRYHPEDEPVVGRDRVVADWLENQDPSGRYDAHYEPLAIDGENHVASGWSRYYNEQGELQDEYWNVYLCRFDDAGRCREFTEWWIQDREFARRARQAAVTAAQTASDAIQA